MLKYSFSCFDKDGNIVIKAIVPSEMLFDFLDKYSNEYVCKAYLIDESEVN